MTKSSHFTVELTAEGDIIPATIRGFSFRGKAVEAAEKRASAEIGVRVLILDAKETLWAEPVIRDDLPRVEDHAMGAPL